MLWLLWCDPFISFSLCFLDDRPFIWDQENTFNSGIFFDAVHSRSVMGYIWNDLTRDSLLLVCVVSILDPLRYAPQYWVFYVAVLVTAVENHHHNEMRWLQYHYFKVIVL